MTARLLSAATPQLFEGALRLVQHYLSAASTVPSSYAEVEGEQARIRRDSRHWLVG